MKGERGIEIEADIEDVLYDWRAAAYYRDEMLAQAYGDTEAEARAAVVADLEDLERALGEFLGAGRGGER